MTSQNDLADRLSVENALTDLFDKGVYDQLLGEAWDYLSSGNKSGIVTVLCKKGLRTPEIERVGVDALKNLGRQARDSEEWHEAKNIGAIAAFKFPGDRFFCLLHAEALFQLNQLRLVDVALAPLGTPANDDVVLLNSHAILAHAKEEYKTAAKLFERLVALEPENYQLGVNYAAALFGLQSWEEAEKVLEKLIYKSSDPLDIVYRLVRIYLKRDISVEEKLSSMDAKYFSRLDSKISANAHTQINIFLQNFENASLGLQAMLDIEEDPSVRFELAEAQLASNNLADGFKNYAIRFQAFNQLAYCNSKLPPYLGQTLDEERLFVWGEQGIGDEILFAFYFEELERRVKNVVVAMEPRLISMYQEKFNSWHFVNRFDPSVEDTIADFVCPAGDLMRLFTCDLLASDSKLSLPYIRPKQNRLLEVNRLLKSRPKKRVCISWRGGRKTNGKIRSLELEEFMSAAPTSDDWEFVSLQFDEGSDDEIRSMGDRRVTFSGLNNKDDIEGVCALIAACDCVISVDNTVAHLAAALGVSTHVVVPAGQTQFRWKNENLKRLLFDHVNLYVQDRPGDWTGAMRTAWSNVHNDLTAVVATV